MADDPEPERLPAAGTPAPLPLFGERFFKMLEESGWLLLIFIILTAVFTVPALIPGVLPALDSAPPAAGVDPELAKAVNPFGLRIIRAGSIATLFSLSLTFIGYAAVRDRGRLAAWFRVDARSIGLGIAAGVALFATGVGYEYLLRVLGIQVPDVAADLVAALPFWLLFLAAGVLAPIGEELYFRGRLYEGLSRWYGDSTAGSLTAALFALSHLIAPLLPIYFLFGLVLLALRRRTGGLAAPIVAHFVNNAAGLLITWVAGIQTP